MSQLAAVKKQGEDLNKKGGPKDLKTKRKGLILRYSEEKGPRGLSRSKPKQNCLAVMVPEAAIREDVLAMNGKKRVSTTELAKQKKQAGAEKKWGGSKKAPEKTNIREDLMNKGRSRVLAEGKTVALGIKKKINGNLVVASEVLRHDLMIGMDGKKRLSCAEHVKQANQAASEKKLTGLKKVDRKMVNNSCVPKKGIGEEMKKEKGPKVIKSKESLLIGRYSILVEDPLEKKNDLTVVDSETKRCEHKRGMNNVNKKMGVSSYFHTKTIPEKKNNPEYLKQTRASKVTVSKNSLLIGRCSNHRKKSTLDLAGPSLMTCEARIKIVGTSLDHLNQKNGADAGVSNYVLKRRKEAFNLNKNSPLLWHPNMEVDMKRKQRLDSVVHSGETFTKKGRSRVLAEGKTVALGTKKKIDGNLVVASEVLRHDLMIGMDGKKRLSCTEHVKQANQAASEKKLTGLKKVDRKMVNNSYVPKKGIGEVMKKEKCPKVIKSKESLSIGRHSILVEDPMKKKNDLTVVDSETKRCKGMLKISGSKMELNTEHISQKSPTGGEKHKRGMNNLNKKMGMSSYFHTKTISEKKNNPEYLKQQTRASKVNESKKSPLIRRCSDHRMKRSTPDLVGPNLMTCEARIKIVGTSLDHLNQKNVADAGLSNDVLKRRKEAFNLNKNSPLLWHPDMEVDMKRRQRLDSVVHRGETFTKNNKETNKPIGHLETKVERKRVVDSCFVKKKVAESNNFREKLNNVERKTSTILAKKREENCWDPTPDRKKLLRPVAQQREESSVEKTRTADYIYDKEDLILFYHKMVRTNVLVPEEQSANKKKLIEDLADGEELERSVSSDKEIEWEVGGSNKNSATMAGKASRRRGDTLHSEIGLKTTHEDLKQSLVPNKENYGMTVRQCYHTNRDQRKDLQNRQVLTVKSLPSSCEKGNRMNNGTCFKKEYADSAVFNESYPSLRKNKLALVLDLDNTLLHSVVPEELTLTEKNLVNHQSSDLIAWNLTGPIFTKLRPFTRTFLQKASAQFDLFICTKGTHNYAQGIAKILDPDRTCFRDNRIISRDTMPQQFYKKNLELVKRPYRHVIIVDDRKDVWTDHMDNLIQIDKYNYFSTPGTTGFCESGEDEDEYTGALSNVLDIICRVHTIFFNDTGHGGNPLFWRDVRPILKDIGRQQTALKGCKIM